MIRIRLLGPVEISIDGAAAPAELLWRKHLALLVYLARSPRLERPRDHLINLLWADKPEEAARHSLNEAVRILRRYAPGNVDRQQQRVQLAEGSCALDVDDLERALSGGDHATAARLVAGEFMEGFSVADAWEFEDWLARERHHWRERSLHALTTHGRELLARGDTREALNACERALALEDANEEAARIKLNAYAILGDRAGALRFYEQFVTTLAERLGVEPEPQTHALVERIRAERVWSHAADASILPNSRRPPLTGVDTELKELVTLWQTCARERRCGLAVIEGEAGTGKTRLLEELAVRARLDGGRVVSVRAVEADRARGYTTALGMARAAAGMEEPAGAPIDALRSALANVVRSQPLLVCLDDAHWIDPESARALTAVLRDLAHERILFTITCLPGSGGDQLDALRAHIDRDFAGVAIRTRSLTTDELRALARWSLPEYDDTQLERVSRRVSADSAGIPFLAVELLHAIANGLDLAGTNTAWPEPFRTFEQSMPGDLPDAIVAAIRIGFRKLSRDAQLTLAAASVLEARVATETLASATALEPARLHEALDELEWQRWLVADPRGYSFVARIAREVVARDMITEGQRQRFLAQHTPASIAAGAASGTT